MTTKAQSTNEPELKPCWCREGTSALSIKAHMDHGEFRCRERARYVYCSNCWACGPARNTDPEAIKVWNEFRSRASVAGVVPTVDSDQIGESMPEEELQAAITASKERLHWPFTVKHENCAECAREYEPSPGAPVEQRLFEAKLLGFGEGDRIHLCEPCLKRAVNEHLVSFSSALPASPTVRSNTEPHRFQEHPHYADYCAFSVGDEDYCKRGADHEIHADLPASPVATQDEPCKCGLAKDDPIHSFSTEWQQMHPFTPKTATTPPSTLARKAAEAIRDWLRTGDGEVDGNAINEVAAIIERCFPAENKSE